VEGLVLLGLTYPNYIPDPILPAYRLYYQSSDRNIIQVTDCAQYDSGLFYILKAGTCEFRNREFDVQNSINSAGLRDDEASLASPEIVVLGDSYAMGWGVNQDEAFPQVLEKISQQRVLNAGISSYGTAREVTLFNRLTRSSIKTIFLQYHANDFEENTSFIENHYTLPIRKESTYDSLRFHINKREDYFPFKHLYGVTKAASRKLFHPAPAPVSDLEAASKMLDVLTHLNIDKTKVRIIVFKLDDYDRIDDGFIHAVDSLANTEPYQDWNLSTVSLSGLFTEDDYFVLDDHINASGHRKIAHKLAESLNPMLH
jgi:lysophospholipase L1-like esterase